MLIADTPGWTEPAARLGGVALFGLVLPQVLGFLAFRWTRRQELCLRLPAVLIPPVVFFVTVSVFWTLYAKAIQRIQDATCVECSA
jgi:hypothetical protein